MCCYEAVFLLVNTTEKREILFLFSLLACNFTMLYTKIIEPIAEILACLMFFEEFSAFTFAKNCRRGFEVYMHYIKQYFSF